MAATLSELQARLDALKKALATGVKSVSYGDRRVEYRDMSEIRTAITVVEADISALSGAAPVRVFRFISEKGL